MEVRNKAVRPEPVEVNFYSMLDVFFSHPGENPARNTKLR